MKAKANLYELEVTMRTLEKLDVPVPTALLDELDLVERLVCQKAADLHALAMLRGQRIKPSLKKKARKKKVNPVQLTEKEADALFGGF